MKAKRFLSALAILLIGSAFTANAEQIFADIQPEQRNDSVMTVNIYVEGDQLKDIKELTDTVDFLKNSKFDEMGELTSVEVILQQYRRNARCNNQASEQRHKRPRS